MPGQQSLPTIKRNQTMTEQDAIKELKDIERRLTNLSNNCFSSYKVHDVAIAASVPIYDYFKESNNA